MTRKEQRDRKRKRIRRIRFFLRLQKRIVLCILGLMMGFGCVRLVGTMQEPISAQESDVIQITEESSKEAKHAVPKETGEWNLILVNSTHPVDEAYVADIELTLLRNGQSVDTRCYPDLQKMMDDCRAEGYNPIICSSFRTYQRQQELFEQQVKKYRNQGMNRKAAETEAAKSVAIPGTSEHELGLAVDICDIKNQRIVSGMETQPVQRWLMENSWKYGFILRYPADKADITGIVYEPWHYRYVGKEVAKYIYENHITLEEYVDSMLATPAVHQ